MDIKITLCKELQRKLLELIGDAENTISITIEAETQQEDTES